MWVRSQTKGCLIDCSYFNYEDDIIWGRVSGVEKIVPLGRYRSKEDALKVLDMMEKHIHMMYVSEVRYHGRPFQMPQDSEV